MPPLRRATARAQDAAANGACSSSALPSSQRIWAGLAAERLEQHSIEPEFARVAELLDADRHGVVPGRRLRAVGAEQTIPPRQIESKIAVGLARHYRVMHPVHVRRHDEPAQHAV